MKKRSIISIFLILLVLFNALAFSSCNNEDDRIEVRIWHSSGSQQDEALNDIVNRFNASQDKIKVIAESQPSANFLSNVYSAVANGVGPDIIFNFASTVADYLPDNKVVNLGQYFDLEELQATVPQAIYDECASFGDGNLYCLPLHSSGPVLFYDKALYNELNLSVPTTWEELASNSKVIFEEKGIAGFGADSLTDLMQCLILQNGSGYIDTENKKVLFNNEKTKESLEWFGSNVRAGYFTNEKDGNYFYNNFNAGLLGSFIGSCGCEEYLTNENYGVAPIPQANTATKWVPTWNRALIVFKSTNEQEAAAAEFLKFFTNAENSAQWSIASGNISPYSYVNNDDYKNFLTQNKALAVVNDSKENSSMLPTIVGSSTVRTELEKLATLAISEENSVTDILNDAEAKCNAALNNN